MTQRTISAAQQEALTVNRVTKPANQAQWMVFNLTHVDWSDTINLVAITEDMGVEYDETVYTFEGVQYKPVSMTVTLPSETAEDNGNLTITFARAGSVVKARMAQITPTNARVPITFEYLRYLEGSALPVESFNGYVAVNYPQISGEDVSIQAEIYNPSLLTSRYITNLDTFPELRGN